MIAVHLPRLFLVYLARDPGYHHEPSRPISFWIDHTSPRSTAQRDCSSHGLTCSKYSPSNHNRRRRECFVSDPKEWHGDWLSHSRRTSSLWTYQSAIRNIPPWREREDWPEIKSCCTERLGYWSSLCHRTNAYRCFPRDTDKMLSIVARDRRETTTANTRASWRTDCRSDEKESSWKTSFQRELNARRRSSTCSWPRGNSRIDKSRLHDWLLYYDWNPRWRDVDKRGRAKDRLTWTGVFTSGWQLFSSEYCDAAMTQQNISTSRS